MVFIRTIGDRLRSFLLCFFGTFYTVWLLRWTHFLLNCRFISRGERFIHKHAFFFLLTSSTCRLDFRGGRVATRRYCIEEMTSEEIGARVLHVALILSYFDPNINHDRIVYTGRASVKSTTMMTTKMPVLVFGFWPHHRLLQISIVTFVYTYMYL